MNACIANSNPNEAYKMCVAVVNVIVNRFLNWLRCMQLDSCFLFIEWITNEDHYGRHSVCVCVCVSNDDDRKRKYTYYIFADAGANGAFNLSYWSNKVYVNRMSNKLTHAVCRFCIIFPVSLEQTDTRFAQSRRTPECRSNSHIIKLVQCEQECNKKKTEKNWRRSRSNALLISKFVISITFYRLVCGAGGNLDVQREHLKWYFQPKHFGCCKLMNLFYTKSQQDRSTYVMRHEPSNSMERKRNTYFYCCHYSCALLLPFLTNGFLATNQD